MSDLEQVENMGVKDDPGEAARLISNWMSETSNFEERPEKGGNMDI